MGKRKFFGAEHYVRNEEENFFIPDDVTLNNTIKMILLKEPMLFDSIICVNTINQEVTLSGFVDSEIEKDYLDRVVLELCKFINVINKVEVMPKLWNFTGDTGCDPMQASH
ncbi:BON domain-containing protein [Limnobacter parvus]|uniref:BON domain-containing protein n=1 Tax=Limnobacter parvus TaxID=2939690 RepID=A0ABT1XJJ4_9BURK|nr:BON domain-containing protein [Limnobacter parvus]MCR2746733.1 BON domain-containing protein [Limnobacter parvus]